MTMLAKTTLKIMKSGLEGDPSVSPRDRVRIMKYLSNCGIAALPNNPGENVARIIRRAEAARRMSCSLRTIDKLAATGVLKKRRLPGRVRASGFLESDVVALSAG